MIKDIIKKGIIVLNIVLIGVVVTKKIDVVENREIKNQSEMLVVNKNTEVNSIQISDLVPRGMNKLTTEINISQKENLDLSKLDNFNIPIEVNTNNIYPLYELTYFPKELLDYIGNPDNDVLRKIYIKDGMIGKDSRTIGLFTDLHNPAPNEETKFVEVKPKYNGTILHEVTHAITRHFNIVNDRSANKLYEKYKKNLGEYNVHYEKTISEFLSGCVEVYYHEPTFYNDKEQLKVFIEDNILYNDAYIQ